MQKNWQKVEETMECFESRTLNRLRKFQNSYRQAWELNGFFDMVRRGYLVKKLMNVFSSEAHDPNEVDGKSGLSLLHIACLNPMNNSGFVRRLLNAGADPCAKDMAGSSALVYALWSSAGKFGITPRDVVFNLLEKGGDPNEKDVHGVPMMAYAAMISDFSLFEALEKRGDVDLSQEDSQGISPVFYAALFGDVDVFSGFLNAGVSVDVRDPQGLSLVTYVVCSSWDREAKIRLLREKGASLNAFQGNPLRLIFS